MRNWILLAVALAAASAAPALAESVRSTDDAGALPPPPQIVVVPESPPLPPPPPAQAADGGTTVVIDVPTAGDDAGTSQVAAGEPDAGPGEEIILLVPRRPPPPPEPPKQIKVTVMHTPRPRVEYGQAALELGISSGVYVAGSVALLVGELLPIVLTQLFGAPNVANVMLDVFSLANAVVLPLGTTIAIERTKVYSRHYELEGLGWWATFGAGLLVQGINAAVTIPTTNLDSYYQAAPYMVGFGLLTPISQTVLAQALATPRDPLAPLEGTARRPVLLDGKGRPIRIVTVLSLSF